MSVRTSKRSSFESLAGQYGVGGGYFVRNMEDGYVTYITLSKDFIELASRRIYHD